MRKCFFLGIFLIMLSACLPAATHAQKLVYVVRHAERADGGMTQTQSDPPLSVAGAARAAKLAVMLGEAGIKAIYVTEYRRTQDTAKPLAAKLGLVTQQVSARETGSLLSQIRSAHAQDCILIIGHSNTVPAIIKELGGPDVTIADDEYDNLFLVVPGTGVMTKIKF
jgi:broad specificity phosphatase PhoE